MSDPLEEVRAAFERDHEFERAGDSYRLTSTPFTLIVRCNTDSTGALAYTVETRVPSLDAAVADERISDALLEGWAEPMEQRLTDVHQATSLDEVDVSCAWDRERFTATFRFRRHARAPAPLEEIRAIAGYVEGTYLQGTIPGYTYRSPVDDLLEKARERASGTESP